MRATKIIATLGPETAHPEAIAGLVAAGVNAFRLNLSYDEPSHHAALVDAVRAVEQEVGRPIALIADVSGPRFRIGPFAHGSLALETGQSLILDQDETPGGRDRVHLPVPAAFTSSRIGDLLRLDDGRVALRVLKVSPVALHTVVVSGTELSGNKIISLPNVPLQHTKLSTSDCDQIDWARQAGIDWLGVSWPHEARTWQALRARAGSMKLLAKIESRACLAAATALIDGADGLLVARGDLGYDLPAEEIPEWQKRLVRDARAAGKPVVIAAQMLESMVSSPAPTRAEASDVANAVKDGADALMLSAETAIGAYPREAVSLMASVIDQTEVQESGPLQPMGTAPTITQTIAYSAAQAADALGAPVIFCFTTSGSTATAVARTRPKTAIVCASDRPQTLRQMQISWGLDCVAAPALKSWKDVVDTAVKLAKDRQIPAGAPLVITAGMPFGRSGSTNILRIATAE